MSRTFHRAGGELDWAPRRPVSDSLDRPGRLQARGRYWFALVSVLAALALQQVTAGAAAVPYQATLAAHSSATAPAVARPAQTARGTRSVPPAVTVAPAPATTAPPATTVPPQQLAATTPARTPVTSPPTTVHAASQPSDFGCGPALAYLAAHAAPGFHFECPGYSLGHQAMTCINVAGVCSGQKLIVITVPCRAAYMNESSNSWSMQGLSSAPIDPYGYCH
ncbi:MAG TPA: hypothetical protein VNF71_06070 [Acidimicrobiales bacterium]|nr:hypothetical protein [Acidimicrobiales bacterium]